MNRPLADSPPRSVLVFRALQLGDLLCSVPALRALRSTLPDAHIALVGLPTMRSFAARYPSYIDEYIDFPGAPGFPEQSEDGGGLPAFLERLRARRFDLAIQMHGSGGPANVLVRGFGAAVTAGFHRPAERDDGAWGAFVDWDAEPNEVRRYLALVRDLGGVADASADATLELPIDRAERDAWTTLRRVGGLDGASLVCLHPGARWSSRRWPLERFVEIGVAMARRGHRLVVTGSADERELVTALVDGLRQRDVAALDLCGRTSLGSLAALLQDATLLVSNDTGISHVAAAMRTPSVVVASGSDVVRWAPVDTRLHRVVWHDVPCRPCSYRDCPIDHPCARRVEVAHVMAAIDSQASVPTHQDRHAA